MWRLATIVRRGLNSSGTGIEKRSGHRNAVVRTLDGKLWHISDRTFCRSACVIGQIPVMSRDRRGPFPFPRRGSQLVIINTDGAAAKHGANPEPTKWLVASEYRKALGMCLARGSDVSHIAQPGVIRLVFDYMSDDFGPTNREAWIELERRIRSITRQGVTPEFMEYIKDYYLLGHY